MKQINAITLAHLHVNEGAGFLTQVSTATSALTVEGDAPTVQAFVDAAAAFNDSLKPITGNSFTAERKAIDEKVDRLYTGFRMFAEAQTYSHDAEITATAEQTFAIIKRYGNLNRMGYAEQYPNLTALLDEVTEIVTVPKLAPAGLMPWIVELQNGYNEFMEVSAEKVAEETQKHVGLSLECCAAAEDAYQALVMRVNAGAVYVGTESYETLIDTTNVLVDEYKTLIASRKTRTANAKLEATETP